MKKILKNIWFWSVSVFARVSENVAHLIALCSATLTFGFLLNGSAEFHVLLFAGITLISEVVSTISGYARRYLDKIERRVIKQEISDMQSQIYGLKDYLSPRMITDSAKAILIEHLKNSNKRPSILFAYDGGFDSASTAHMLRRIFEEAGWRPVDGGSLLRIGSEARDILICANPHNRNFAPVLSNWLTEAGFPTDWRIYSNQTLGHMDVIVHRTSSKLGG